jgi:hypothetical protein
MQSAHYRYPTGIVVKAAELISFRPISEFQLTKELMPGLKSLHYSQDIQFYCNLTGYRAAATHTKIPSVDGVRA